MAAGASSIVRTVCPHDCPDACSLLVTVEDERVTQVQGDPDHPFTRGWLCGKVNHYEQRVHSPERLLTPLRRTGPKGAGQFALVGWDEALDEIATRWRQIIKEHGGEALLGYAYSSHQGIVNRNLPRALFHALGATRMLAGTVCDSCCGAGWEAAVGATVGTDLETIVDSDFILVWGANLLSTNAHLWPFIEQARDNGATITVIDPFRTRTARKADVHLRPRVGTDTALALGIMHVLVRDGLLDQQYVSQHTSGFEQLCAETLPLYPPARVAEITGIAEADIEALAAGYGRARAPFLKLGMGLSRHRYGGMTIRAIAMLPALVGAWRRTGGGAHLDSSPLWSFDVNALRRPDLEPRPAREVNHSQLGRALLEFNAPPILALFVMANNPATTCPDQARVIKGLAREDLFTVVHDTFMTDTARYADIVLPAATSFESEDLYRSYGTYYLQHGPQVIEPMGEARSNAQLVQDLARRLNLDEPVFSQAPREHIRSVLAGARGPVATLTLDQLTAGGPHKAPYVNPGPEMTHFASREMEAQGQPVLPEWRPDRETAPPHPLRLLTLPGHTLHHSVFDGVPALRRRAGAPTAVLHPTDAAARGIRDGDPVLLFNDHGEAGLLARVSDDTLPGVVAVEGSRARAGYLRGGPINALVSDDLTDLGAGATYQSTYLDAKPLS